MESFAAGKGGCMGAVFSILGAWALGAPPEPTRTSPIVLTPGEKVVCAVHEDCDAVSLWEWAGAGSVRNVTVGEEPRTLAVSPDGRYLYVTTQRSETLAVVDVARAQRVRTIALGGQPYGVLLAPGGDRAFVSHYAGGYLDGKYHAGMVSAVDLVAGETSRRLPVQARPWAMALDGAGRTLYVTHYLHIAGKGLVTEIDAEALAVRREIPLAEDPDVAGGRGGIVNALSSIAIHPRGHRAVVAAMHANARRGRTLSGQPLSHKTAVQAALRILDLEGGSEIFAARMVSSFSGQAVAVPAAVAFVGDGEHLMDLYFASSDLKVLRYNERGIVAERALLALPPGPTGIAVTRDGERAFVSSRFARSVSEIVLADVREPVVARTVPGPPDLWDPRRLRGAILFHSTRDPRMTANRWMSCGVCHLDGGLISDTLVWDLTAEGAPPKVSNTKDLFNLRGTAPPFFHRGTDEVIPALERFVRVSQGGSGFLARAPETAASVTETLLRDLEPPAGDVAGDEWGAILAYIESLEARPSPHARGGSPREELLAAARRGRRLFFDEEVNCSRCHCGPAWTVSGISGRRAVFDVGTGGRFDVPSLARLWDTAPYLHDGRAATLRDVLAVHNPEDRHGRTRHLSASDLDDLTVFLLAPGEDGGG